MFPPISLIFYLIPNIVELGDNELLGKVSSFSATPKNYLTSYWFVDRV